LVCGTRLVTHRASYSATFTLTYSDVDSGLSLPEMLLVQGVSI